MGYMKAQGWNNQEIFMLIIDTFLIRGRGLQISDKKSSLKKKKKKRAVSLETFGEMSNKSNRLPWNSLKAGKSQISIMGLHKSTSSLFLVKLT